MLQPEGKEMKEIVYDFALANEMGGLESRYETAVCWSDPPTL